MAETIGHKLMLRHLRMEDYDDLHEISVRVYKDLMSVPWPESLMRRLVETFRRDSSV